MKATTILLRVYIYWTCLVHQPKVIKLLHKVQKIFKAHTILLPYVIREDYQVDKRVRVPILVGDMPT